MILLRQMNNMTTCKAAKYYLDAKAFVYDMGYYYETYACEQAFEITKEFFLKEYAWVVLSSGLSEKVVKSAFEKLSKVCGNWESVDYLANNKDIRCAALKIFNSPTKIDAILNMAQHLLSVSINSELEAVRLHGPSYLTKYKYLGPATAFHFAKNLGLDVMKPDRHLVRITEALGYSDPHLLCAYLSNVSGDNVRVVDQVLWRFATLNPRYVS